MVNLKLVEEAVELGAKLARSPALEKEVAALLGRTPKAAKAVEATGSFSSLEEEIAHLLGRPKIVGAASEQLGQVVTSGIPPLKDGFLPPGVYLTQWPQMLERYGSDPNRAKFLPGMFHAMHDLREFGVKKTYLGGSFPTAKITPNDFDMTFQEIPRYERSPFRAKVFEEGELVKKAYGGDCQYDCLDFFKQTRNGRRVGVLKFELDDLPPRSETSPLISAYSEWRKEKAKAANLVKALGGNAKKPFSLYDFST